MHKTYKLFIFVVYLETYINLKHYKMETLTNLDGQQIIALIGVTLLIGVITFKTIQSIAHKIYNLK